MCNDLYTKGPCPHTKYSSLTVSPSNPPTTHTQTLQTSFPMSCNEVLPEWISLKTDIWSFGTMLVKFFVGSRGPSSQREVC